MNPLKLLSETPGPAAVGGEYDSDSDSDSIFFSFEEEQPPPPEPRIDPAPHISSQFYTFNRHSHALMIRCILDSRAPSPAEIRAVTPAAVLSSWRAVWKGRKEDTAYLTSWKRIQHKLSAHADTSTSLTFLYFKSNPAQYVSHCDQWQDIVSECHTDPGFLLHLGLKETLDRIRQSWTVGTKFYGIPESFVRACVSNCQKVSLLAKEVLQLLKWTIIPDAKLRSSFKNRLSSILAFCDDWRIVCAVLTYYHSFFYRYLEERERNPDMDSNETLEHFIKSHGYSPLFQKAYLIPICSSI